MAEIISIRVNVNDGDYKRTTGRLLEIQKHIETLNKTPVHIKIDDTGFEKATKQITAYNNSVARMVKAENELAVAKEKTAQAQAKAEAEAWKAEQQETRLATTQVNRHTQTIRQQTEIIKGENQIALQKEKTATVVARTAQEEAKANTALVQGQARLAVQQEKTATETAKAEAAQMKQNAAMQEGSAASSLLNNSLGSLVLQYVSLRMIISKVVSAFRDALNTMKEVDSELVTIQKTTGYSGQQLDRLTDSAYKLASAYGRTATEILNAASVYARAGFKDNLEDMTELSALLQNVGDLSGEMAAKFLVATNAAWQMNGSYDALLRVIDGLNQQTNEAAVDMQALTSGITVAGSVFSNAGESVQTFAGLLGAGVALTQRSGSEIARGLRTIAMNIRQIKGELDDGEIIDEASISDAAAALHSVGISVADANGELRLTSDVLTDLAAKWGSLTTAEQSYLSQSLAGKRQANILNALMSNWQEAERQMTLYANGAGSAMKENEIYLDSWEAKTKQLDAAWTEFVANLVDTDLIKGALDGVIKVVQFLDTEVGRGLVVALAVPSAIFAIVAVVAKLKAAIAALNVTMLSNPVFLAIAAGTLSIYGIVRLVDALTTSTAEYAEAAEKAKNEYNEIQAQVTELKAREEELTDLERRKLELLEKQAEVAREQARSAALDLYYHGDDSGVVSGTPYEKRYEELQRELERASRAEGKEIEKQMNELEQLSKAYNLIAEYKRLLKEISVADSASELEKLKKAANDTMSEIFDLTENLRGFSDTLGEKMPEEGKKTLQTLEDFILTADKMETKSKALAEGQLSLMANTEAADQMARVFGVTLSNYSGALQQAEENTNNITQATNFLAEKLENISNKATSYDTVISSVVSSLNDFGEGSYEVYHAMENLESIIPGSTKKLYDFETATWKIDTSLIESKGDLLDFIDTQKQLEFSNAISQLEDLAAGYWDVAGAALAAMNAQAAQQMASVLSFTGGNFQPGGSLENINSQLAGLRKEKANWDAYIATMRQRTGYRPPDTDSKQTGSVTDEELVKRQNVVALRKAELAFLKASGASEAEIDAKQKEIQAALHDQAEYMRSIGADEADILALSTEWWNIQKELAEVTGDELERLKNIVSLRKAELEFLEASGASEEELNAKRKEIQSALHDQAEYMRSIGADEEDILALSTEWWQIQSEIKKEIEETAEATSDMLAYLKGVVSYRKQELSFLQNSGKSLEEINAKRKEIQAGLHEQAEYLRAQLEILKAQEVSEEEKVDHETAVKKLEEDILALSTEWWQIQNDINSDLEKAEQDRISALEEQKKLQQEMFDTLKKTVDDYYAKILSDKEEELSLEEKILAVQKAQADLANAQRERTVRYYNAATGQWEWQANAKNVKSAQDALQKAQDDLNKYQKDQAWKAFKSAWEYVSEQIKAGAMTFREAYDYMYAEMKKIQDTYGVDLGFVLDDSIGGFKELNYGIDGLTQEVADTLGASVGVLYEKLREYETAVGAFKKAFDDASDKVKNGEMSMEDAYSYLRDRAKEIADKYGIDMTGALEEAIAGMDKTNMSIDELWKAVIINLMKVNSARWFDANEEERAYLHAQNEYLGSLIGATYDPSGYWYLNGSQLYGSQRGVDVSGKSGYGESTGGGGGADSAGTSAASASATAIRGAAGTGKFYDSYGNEYATLEEAVAGNAANSGGGSGEGGKPFYKGTGFLAAEGESGKITAGMWGVRVGDAGGYTHWLGETGSFIKSSDGYVYNTATATDYELATLGLFRDGHGGIRAIEDGMYLDWEGMWNDHLKEMDAMYATNTGGGNWSAMTDIANNDLSLSGMDPTLLDAVSTERPVAGSGTVYEGDTYYTMNGVTIGESEAKSTTVYELARMAGMLGNYSA